MKHTDNSYIKKRNILIIPADRIATLVTDFHSVLTTEKIHWELDKMLGIHTNLPRKKNKAKEGPSTSYP